MATNRSMMIPVLQISNLTAENIAKIWNLVRSERRLTVREMVDEFNLVGTQFSQF